MKVNRRGLGMLLYDKSSIDRLLWPNTNEGRYAKNYLSPLIKNDAKSFIDNVETALLALQDKNLILPITVNDKEYSNSYVCSPYSQYISYGLDEIDILDTSHLRILIKAALICMGKLLKAGQINKAVHVNNWLLSTNLYPVLTSQQIKSITGTLKDIFSDHAIMFRSVNATQTELIGQLQEEGYEFLFSRMIYLLDTQDDAPFKERHFKKDLKLLESGGYEIVEPHAMTTEDIPRITELYHSLNIKKYSVQNPQFNNRFIGLALEKGILSFRGLRKDGVLDAVYGCIKRNGMMVAPFFGYDTSKDENLGLYRQLSAIAVLDAKESSLKLNQSAGAASFKKRRKAIPTPEYHAFYVKHLPSWRQAPWQSLKQFGDKLILPYIKKNNI